MIALIVFIGILLLIFGVAAVVLNFVGLREKEEVVEKKNSWGDTVKDVKPASPKFLLAIAGWKKGVVSIGAAIFMFFITSTIFYAEAYEIKKKVVAGITPEVKLKMEIDGEVRKAQALAKIKLPETYVSGGGNGSAGNDALLMMILKELKK